MIDKPYMTAIVPTTRPRWRLLIESLRCLERQTTLTNELLELVFVTDDVRSVESALATVRLPIQSTIIEAEGPLGLKRNIACEAARSEWILFWDDDDWQRSDRLQRTVEATLEVAADVGLVGSQTMLIHELGAKSRRRTFQYRYRRQDATYPEIFFVGGLLAFRRETWQAIPFTDDDALGEEAWWQIRLLEKGVRWHEFTTDPTMYVAMIHGTNTSNKQAPCGDPTWTLIERPLIDLLGPDLLSFSEAAFFTTVADAAALAG